MKIFALLIFTFGGWVAVDGEPCEFIAKTESGPVCGVKKKASNGDEFVSFMGIPYAKAPLGVLRFAEPQRPVPFQGIFNASQPGPVCPQLFNPLVTRIDPNQMSEDCLRINVNVPLTSLPDPEGSVRPLVPVFIYTHGGSFVSGSGNPDAYGPEYVVSKGVMFVTLNYRLNSIGFLSLASKYIPGNAGLRDILFALKWVNRNIANLGGDPNEVTLGGQSSGGVAAHLISISPAVKDQKLFKRVMVLSGNAYANSYSISPITAKIFANLFLQAFNISTQESARSIHRKLANAPIEDILKANAYVTSKTYAVNFSPVIERRFKGHTTIVPKDPEHLIEEGNGKEYTTLLGFADNECALFKGILETYLDKQFKKNPSFYVPLNLLFLSSSFAIPTLTEQILNKYLGNTNRSAWENFVPLCNDGFFRYPVMRLADQRSISGAAPTYMYEFAYDGITSITKTLSKISFKGAGHSDDVEFFLRNNAVLGPLVFDELAQPEQGSMMKDWMTTFIANFVKTGNPASDPESWPPAGDQLWYQSISTPGEYKFQVATESMEDTKRFFDTLYSIGRMEILN